MNSVLVVIVTYNAMRWVHKCFSSIYASSIPLDVFVMDNGSIDGTQEYVRKYYPQVIFHQSESNLGFGKANNIGLRYALDNNYDYVYLLNQDAWLMPDTIEKLISIHKRYPEYGILSPFQLQGNMQRLDKNFASVVCRYEANNELLDDLYFGRTKEVYSVPMVMAAHWLISKECLTKVGGFSPTFPHYGEDDNYTNRTIYHKLKVGIVPSIVAVHDRENRAVSLSKEMYMVYIGILIGLSNIYAPLNNKLFKAIIRIIRAAFHYKSFVPVKYGLQIMYSWAEIKKNARLSRELNAFLSKENSIVDTNCIGK